MYSELNDNYSNIKFMKINNLQKKEKERFNKINVKNYILLLMTYFFLLNRKIHSNIIF